MSETEKELWRAADLAVFKTNEAKTIKDKFAKSYEAYLEERSHLGGYLKSTRLMREMTTSDCAEIVGVSRARWQAWEANVEIPSVMEIESIVEKMGFRNKKHQKLLELQAKAPQYSLKILSQFQPELLAARGVAKVDSRIEWSLLPGVIQDALKAWGKEHGHDFPVDLLVFLQNLGDDQAREKWVKEVLGYLE